MESIGMMIWAAFVGTAVLVGALSEIAPRLGNERRKNAAVFAVDPELRARALAMVDADREAGLAP